VLIKDVAQAIPSYALSIFKFSKGLSAITRFWWGNDHDGHKIHWFSKSKAYQHKNDGGQFAVGWEKKSETPVETPERESNPPKKADGVLSFCQQFTSEA